MACMRHPAGHMRHNSQILRILEKIISTIGCDKKFFNFKISEYMQIKQNKMLTACKITTNKFLKESLQAKCKKTYKNNVNNKAQCHFGSKLSHDMIDSERRR